ncbi:universal stress protein [Streptomyces sp. H27-C3]|uniref:universal stress protein n=1 Tax=Streptomyces sp. H27-C3 TaxID=3046305 RepID=UPI0024BA8A7E|nr:universal stress protein [Streptomyces sp. H27-C3]MDJ0465541.1 universal stress protein [Streptomyces sp. H27-C3]
MGIDALCPADNAIRFALEAAQRQSVRLHAVNAWQLPRPMEGRMPYEVPEADRAIWEDEQVRLPDALRPWRERYPQVALPEDVLRFTAAAALVRAAPRTELLVVGRRRPVLGPVVDAVVNDIRCSLAVVPS